MNEVEEAPAPKKEKLKKATTGDIILSAILPGWGLLVGLIALLKGEMKRSATMMGISAILIAIFVALRLANS